MRRVAARSPVGTFIVNVVVTREVGKNESLTSWLPPESTVVEVPLTTTRYFDLDAVRAALDVVAVERKVPLVGRDE